MINNYFELRDELRLRYLSELGVRPICTRIKKKDKESEKVCLQKLFSVVAHDII